MIGLLATYDKVNNAWSFEANHEIREVPIFIAITGGKKYAKDAKMGFVATQNNFVLKEYVFPKPGHKLVYSDQAYQGYTAVEIPKAEDVEFTFFFEENGVRQESQFSLSPKTSPYPDDGKEYYWDYDIWVLVE